MLAYHVIIADDRLMVNDELNRIMKEKRGLEAIAEVWDRPRLLEFVNSIQPHTIALAPSMPGLMPVEEFNVLVLARDERKSSFPCGLEFAYERYSLQENADSEIIRAIERMISGGIYIFYISRTFFHRLSGWNNRSPGAWPSIDQSSQMASREETSWWSLRKKTSSKTVQ